ncbi:MAG: ribonuclease H-like domain-containing protein [Planctomycetota bacterium]
MLEERLRSRLEALNRQPLPATKAAPRPAAAKPAQPVQSTAGLLDRGEPVATASGEHLRIVVPLEEFWPGGPELLAKRHTFLTEATGERKEDELTAITRSFPEHLVCLDLETCGLAGNALFLIGLLRCDLTPHVELLLARNYSEERSVLEALWQTLTGETLLLTFNGKSFDWPMVVDRTTRHLLFRGTPAPEPTHVDLLHHSRRKWRASLPDCKLQTLERMVCRRSRTGDIPGSQIPAVYQRYVETGDGNELEAVLRHNAIDVVTLLDLAIRLAKPIGQSG